MKEVWGELNEIYSKVEAKKETSFLAMDPEKIKKDIEKALNKMTLLPAKMKTYLLCLSENQR